MFFGGTRCIKKDKEKCKKNGIYLQYSECSELQKIQHEAK